MHIHITGASGSGATTLGAALARALNARHFDGDDYYWLPTSPPFQTKRQSADRLALLRADLASSTAAVLSGSIVGWGAEVEDAFDFIVFLYLPAAVRVERLRQRETEKYGAADPAFLEWAAQYDSGPTEGRSLTKHNAWLAARTCPVLRIEADETLEQRLNRVLGAMPGR